MRFLVSFTALLALARIFLALVTRRVAEIKRFCAALTRSFFILQEGDKKLEEAEVGKAKSLYEVCSVPADS